MDQLARFSINCHSSIRWGGAVTVWFDPFRVEKTTGDGDVIFITHDHYDHFSPEDIRRVMRLLRFTAAAGAGGGHYTVKGIPFTAVPAYNIGKPFHPRSNGWVGYVAELDGLRVYVSGDTDDTPEARAVSCDAAFLPVGGTYTMTAAEAAALANALHPQIAVPTHYGSIVGAMTDGDDFAAQLAPGIRCVKLI